MKTKLHLKEGEIICPRCGGTGMYHKKFIKKPYFRRCSKCLGSGKLDWVELCVGKKPSTIWEKLVLPTVRRKYPKLIAKDLVSVQPIDWGSNGT